MGRSYDLIAGQRLTELEYRKYQVLMKGRIIVRWMTEKEMEEGIKKAQNEK